jgi:hypothetical protein
VISSSHAQ